ncbi:MAG: SusD/RagB family nutrient-binding outer membrane lipoprotein [Flavobacteriaceae bacterium]
MKNNITKIIIILLLAFTFNACSDEFFDVNTPSGTVDQEDLRMNDLLAPVIHSTLEAQRSAELTFGNYTQYFVSEGGGAAGETTQAGLWNQVYIYILPNIKVIKEKASASGAHHFGAVADILTAANLGIATDTWENIPYSEANLGQDNLSPTFDSQQEIYNQIFTLLDGAIATLQAADTSGFTMGNSDLIYNGDFDQWLRAAYTLKARYQIHLLNKGVSASDVLATIANGFTSNSDDFQMDYDGTNLNPWYVSEITARSTGNFHRDIASQLVSAMNGDQYPFMGTTTVDPRLPMFAENGGATEWKGYVSGNGSGLSPDGTAANTGFADGGFYTSESSPLVLISYAEAQFIKAEAAFIANGGSATSTGSNAMAYNAYMDGIAASMSKYGANGADYLADGAIAVGEAGLMLNHIMKEKYIHNFLNPETFVDYRRYDFSNDVFKGLMIREEDDADADYFGEWFRRASYPASEVNGNGINVEANRKSPIVPVWWDE